MFFFLGMICDFHPFDLVNACEEKLTLIEEFDLEIENDFEHEILLNLSDFLFSFIMFFCFSFHQHGHTSHFKNLARVFILIWIIEVFFHDCIVFWILNVSALVE
jgi:hypothetical protein